MYGVPGGRCNGRPPPPPPFATRRAIASAVAAAVATLDAQRADRCAYTLCPAVMFEDIRQFEALHPHFMQLAHVSSGAAHLTQLQAAGSCTVINGSVHPDKRTVTNGGGPTTGYRYYEKCPFEINTTCPANYYHITPSMECGVMGAIVPNLTGPESTPQLLAGNPSHPLPPAP